MEIEIKVTSAERAEILSAISLAIFNHREDAKFWEEQGEESSAKFHREKADTLQTIHDKI